MTADRRCASSWSPKIAGAWALAGLLAAPESPETVAVVTATEPEGRRRPLVATAAARHGLDVLSASTLRDGSFAETIRKLDVDLLFSVHSFSVLGSDVVRAPRIGSFKHAPPPAPGVRGSERPQRDRRR